MFYYNCPSDYWEQLCESAGKLYFTVGASVNFELALM